MKVAEYRFDRAGPSHTMAYLVPAIERLAGSLIAPGARVLDLGCGAGWLAGWFADRGCQVVGVDPSDSGLRQAREHHPNVRFVQAQADESLLKNLGEPPFDLVVSTEVVEHVYAPRAWARACATSLRPGGRLVCSTPYHGWLKNVVVAVTNRFDAHVNPLWDGGHIKFWSPATLTRLVQEAGFGRVVWTGAGRAPLLWKSFVLSGALDERVASEP